MKVKVITSTNEKDCRNRLRIEVDGHARFRFCDGEPEDANLSRDFNDCYGIPEILKLAYEAGKNGEDFSIEEVEEEW